MKTLGIFFLGGTSLALIAGLVLISKSSDSIIFESLESKTEKGLAVFNEIRFQSSGDHDVWIMRQSHHGLQSVLANGKSSRGHGSTDSRNRWDRLAIVVDRSQAPVQAQFYQLASGDQIVELPEISKLSIDLKARCFACHSNGPRAIRPAANTEALSLSFLNRLQIFGWNMRAKLYGHVDGKQRTGEGSKNLGVDVKTAVGRVPFRSEFSFMSSPLGLSSCVKCHDEGGIRNP